LERRGWRGHFFITTDRIGMRGFLTEAQLRELHRRGHIIGSHSSSHPARMATLTRTDLDREWRQSIDRLSRVLGDAVKVASVPGGYYSREVGESAAAAGIEALFTSEPTAQVEMLNGCRDGARVVRRFRRRPCLAVLAPERALESQAHRQVPGRQQVSSIA
jgi:peptidoglycan/xylan/chitin deacetylase (PgdA/CDA1 family)